MLRPSHPTRAGGSPELPLNAKRMRRCPMKTYRMIQVGTGGHGAGWCQLFLPPNVQDGLIEIVAAVDINPDALNNAQAFLGLDASQCYTDIHQAFAENRADFCTVVVPPAYHEAVVDAALAHGMHILSEKPIADSIGRVGANRRQGQARRREDGRDHEPPLRPGQDDPARRAALRPLLGRSITWSAASPATAARPAAGEAFRLPDSRPADGRRRGAPPRHPGRFGGSRVWTPSTRRPGTRHGASSAAIRRPWSRCSSTTGRGPSTKAPKPTPSG